MRLFVIDPALNTEIYKERITARRNLAGKCKKLLTDNSKKSGDDREFNRVSPKNLVTTGNSI
ncbi:MAG: hypothetical protein LBD28_01615, partial [Tannerellaceae bacterium]|nr:hypothetical protein [Tannerellaceae bacterium]